MLDKVAALALTKIKNVKKETLRTLLEDKGLSIKDVNSLHAVINQRLNKNFALEEIKKLYALAIKEISEANSKSIQIITIADPGFPSRLKCISNPPLILYAKGNISILNSPMSVAVVGTREVSSYGANLAYTISSSLAAKQNVVIVSGLALGCDTRAHLGCLASHGKTVAVLAHGLDFIYPAENTKLAQDILRNDGCLISEYAPGIRPQRFHFLNRNRIQSGLSQATLIIESKKQGGTMTTARHCREQGRMLYCVQPSAGANQQNFEGNNSLIKEGAIPLLEGSIDNLLKSLSESSKEKLLEVTGHEIIMHSFFAHKKPPIKRAGEAMEQNNGKLFKADKEQAASKLLPS